MKLRMLIALLLTLTIGWTAVGSPQEEAEDSAAAAAEKITPDEEREARELAARFIKRWQETEDIDPLIKEFFVTDFAERLHHEPQLLYFGELKGDQSILKNSADLKRHYAAMINFLRLVFRLEEIYAPLLESEAGQEETNLNLKRILPAGMWELFKSNPVMNALMSEETGEGVEDQTGGTGQGEDSKADARVIKSIEELRSLTTTLEQANTLLSAHLKTLPNTISVDETVGHTVDDAPSSASEEDDPLMLRSYTLYEDFYGYPKGTRLIRLNVMAFHIDLVRVEGHLKILALYLQTD